MFFKFILDIIAILQQKSQISVAFYSILILLGINLRRDRNQCLRIQKLN